MINQRILSENQDKIPRNRHRREPSVVEHSHFHEKKPMSVTVATMRTGGRGLMIISRFQLTDSAEELRYNGLPFYCCR